MRPSVSDCAAAVAAFLRFACLASLAAPACSAPPPELSPRAPPPPTSAPAPLPPPAATAHRQGRTLLAEPRQTTLGFVLQPIAGGRSALAVAQLADERAAWVRRIDGGAASATGPLLRFVDQHVFGAFDRADGTTTIVTSDGTHVCFGASSRSAERTCVQSNPAAIVPVGDRLALLELTTMRPSEPAPRAPRPAVAHPPPRPKVTKGGTHKRGGSGKGARRKPAHAGAAHRPVHPLVELFVRWVEPSGSIAAEATPTGLHFEAPIEGMTLADARARGSGIDVLWFETAPKRPTHAGLGSGRLMTAELRADGSLDFDSRVAVVDADLEYGQLKDHHAPRLAGSEVASIYVDLDARGQCEALRLRPTPLRLAASPAVCAVAPDLLAGTLAAPEIAAIDRIFADDPSRAFGQPRNDPGLVAWAGARAYYLHGTALRSAARADGASRDESPPFSARRASIAWGALAPDGEGVAFADGVVHLAGSAGEPGHVERAPAATALPSPVTAPELPADRRRAVRIGATWWTARGLRARVWPPDGPTPTPAPAHPDVALLVGGTSSGISLEMAGGAMNVGSVSVSGAVTALGAIVPGPVRAGFDACERAGGGAIVAGARASNPAEVVAFTVDASGHASPPRPVPLRIHPGELGVRLVPLPSGGALLTDLERRQVVWLDDDAGPQVSAPWPPDASDAVCPEGRPMPRVVPAPTPGQLVPVPDVAEGACIVGDPAWALDGTLRWFGGTAEGLDFYPELARVPVLPAALPAAAAAQAPAVASAAAPAPLPGPRLCPPDMVSIAGRFCVDRFEAMIVDARTGAFLSPDYPTTPNLLDFVLGEWSTARERTGNVHARAFPLPWIAPSRTGDKPEPLAVSRLGVRPSGYLTGVVAAAACAAAGKRLCTLDEFVLACRGEGDTLFPYGDTYEDGACNVFREEHPAVLLHGNASVGHLDPRLNRVVSRGRPLLQRTGESPACRSRWGDDAVYDMVGNIDEWVDEGGGAFAGGFYSRSTRSGCEAVVTAHPKSYLDYSTGARCCRDKLPPAAAAPP